MKINLNSFGIFGVGFFILSGCVTDANYAVREVDEANLTAFVECVVSLPEDRKPKTPKQYSRPVGPR